ncbi:hypothetical protein VTJ04DRAFT_3409 [Mycothermus thermophilus]|uniref:uncharacterized protein n=1 Tax=Humicola insolens TaxID=85995 RepID=UPI0037436A94
MAEVLELVAGGIAIYQGAEALVKLAVSLRRLWKEIQDVPTTIQDTLTELERVAILLETVKAELMPTASECVGGGSAIPSIQSLAIAECHRVQRELEALVTDLASDIASKRGLKKRVAQTRVVLKKDELEKHDRRLQRAVGFLNSTIQLFLAASIKQQPALIAREMAHALGPSIQQQSMVVATEVASILATQQSRPASASNSNRRAGNAATGSDSDRAGEEEEAVQIQIVGAADCRPSKSGSHTSATRRRVKVPKLHSILHRLGIDLLEAEEQNVSFAPPTKSYYIGINPLKKLFNKAWDLQISVACSGWNFGFRTYAVIPNFCDMPWLEEEVDSTLYRPADIQFLRTLQEGTLEELLKLFRDGLATPFMKDQWGGTLLGWMMMHRCDLVKPLLDTYFKPSDLLIQNDRWVTPLDIYMWDPFKNWVKSTEDDIAVHRYILSHDIYEYARTGPFPDNEEDLFERVRTKPDSRSSAFNVMARSVEHFESMREAYFVDFYQWPLENRALLATQHFMNADPKALALFYSDTPNLHAMDIRTPMICRKLSEHPLPLYYHIFDCWSEIVQNQCTQFYGYSFESRFTEKAIQSLMNAILSILETSELSKPVTFARSTILVKALWSSSTCGLHDGCSLPHCNACFFTPKRSALRDKDMIHQTDTKTAMRKALHGLLEDMKAAGHNLVVYGQAEKRVTDIHVPPWEEWFKESRLQDGTWHCRVVRRRFTGFKYGPNPDDWDLEFEVFPEDRDKPWKVSSEVDPEYVWVEELRGPGDLYDEERKKRPRMPGAWVENDQDDASAEDEESTDDDDDTEYEESTEDEESEDDEDYDDGEEGHSDEGGDQAAEDDAEEGGVEMDPEERERKLKELEEMEKTPEKLREEVDHLRQEKKRLKQRIRELRVCQKRLDVAQERVGMWLKEEYTELYQEDAQEE